MRLTAPGWINSDIKERPGIDLSCDILDGLPLDDESIDYITSQHALQELVAHARQGAERNHPPQEAPIPATQHEGNGCDREDAAEQYGDVASGKRTGDRHADSLCHPA